MRRKKTPKPAPERLSVSVSVPGDVLMRLDAFGERERERVGLDPKRGPLLLMLARKGLAVVEAEAAS